MTLSTQLLVVTLLVMAAAAASAWTSISAARARTPDARGPLRSAVRIAQLYTYLLTLTVVLMLILSRSMELSVITQAQAEGAKITWKPGPSFQKTLAMIEHPGQPPSGPILIPTWASVFFEGFIWGQGLGALFLLVPSMFILKLVKPHPESRGFEISPLTPAPAPAAPSPLHHLPSQDASRSPSAVAAPPVAAGTPPVSGS